MTPPTLRLMPSIALAGNEPFAKGGYRHAYVHPDNPDLCVKVPARRDDTQAEAMQRREIADWKWLLRHGREAWFERIPVIHGVAHTDQGTGIVSQLCRDANGQISRNLAIIMRTQGGDVTPALVAEIEQFKEWIRRERMLTRDTGPQNMIAQRLYENTWKLVIAEGWVHPLCRWLPGRFVHGGNAAGRRQIAKFERRMPRA